MPTAKTGDDNGKVTVAILGERVKVLIAQNEAFFKRFDAHLEQAAKRDERLSVLETRQLEVCELAKDNREELKGLWKRSNLYDGLVAAFSAFAAVIAAIWGGSR